jgi:hypothetical protein
MFEDFGDSNLVFGLYFWIDVQAGTSGQVVMSDLRFMIEKSFAGMLSMSSLMGTAALMAQSDDAKAATVEWAEHFQKNYRLMTPRKRPRRACGWNGAIRRVRQEGDRRHHRGPARRADGLCAEHPQVHRLPPLRQGLRRGKQPVARPAPRGAHRVDPGAAHGARRILEGQDGTGLPGRPGHPGRRQRLHPGRPGARRPVPLRARGRAREGRHLHADRLHAVREAALREGVPGAHHLPRGRRPGGDRLQLVHRLQACAWAPAPTGRAAST